jgi:hypothetical protein
MSRRAALAQPVRKTTKRIWNQEFTMRIVLCLVCVVSAGCESSTSQTDLQDSIDSAASAAQASHLDYTMLVNAPTTDPQAAAAALTAKEFWPTGCSTSAPDAANPLLVRIHLTDCNGPFGVAHWSGDLAVTFSQGTGGALHLHGESSNMTAGVHPASWTRDADIDVNGDTRTVTGTGSWTRTNDRSEVTSHTSSYTITIDAAAQCRTVNGTATSTIGGRTVDSTFDNYKICRVACTSCSVASPDGCPSGLVSNTFNSDHADVVMLSFGAPSMISGSAVEIAGGCNAATLPTGAMLMNKVRVIGDGHGYWLEDANLAAAQRFKIPICPDAGIYASSDGGVDGGTVPCINQNGTMDYKTACLWIQRLNKDSSYNLTGGTGAGHWQLPSRPPGDQMSPGDPTCSSTGPQAKMCSPAPSAGHNSFGAWCSGSVSGNLFYGTGEGTLSSYIADANNGYVYTGSVAPAGLTDAVGPFSNLQPGLYWALHSSPSPSPVLADTFTFSLGLPIQNSVADNYFHVLPMVQGWIGFGPAPSPGHGLVSYQGGEAVYDSDTGCTWASNANLAATPAARFSALQCTTSQCTATTTIPYKNTTKTVPLISASGSMLWSTANEFIDAMNQLGPKNYGYAGSTNWTLPQYGAKPTQKECNPSPSPSPGPCQCSNLETLFEHLQQQAGLVVGDPRLSLPSGTTFGGFHNLQPFFYWSCMADPSGQCSSTPAGYSGQCVSLWSSFYFDTGFEGSDEATKQFNVMVYWPDPPPTTSSPDCSMLE